MTPLVRELNSPALSLILISSSRAFLRYNCRGLRGLSLAARQTYPPGDQSRAFRHLEAIFEDSPVNVSQFERILAEFDSGIKKTYQASAFSEADRQSAEKEMLIAADIPEALVQVVQQLLTSALDNLKNEIDPAALYFTDHSWLGLADDTRSEAYRQEHVVDAIHKVELDVTPEMRLRRCTRCCAIMEDVMPQKGNSLWMVNMQRMCFCGSLWMLAGTGGA